MRIVSVTIEDGSKYLCIPLLFTDKSVLSIAVKSWVGAVCGTYDKPVLIYNECFSMDVGSS